MNRFLFNTFIFSLLLLLVSCGSKKNLSKATRNANLQQTDFSYFKSKIKINYIDEEQNFDLTASLRMKKDEAVWVTLLGPFNVKIGKALITKDSVQVLRDFQAKEYYAYSLKELNKKNNANLSLSLIQNLILGNLISQGKPSLKKTDQNIQIEQKEGLFKILSTVVASKIGSVTINHTQQQGNITIDYNEYQEVDNKTIPSRSVIKIDNDQIKATTKLQLKNSTFTDEELSFPFNASSKYVRK